MALKKLRLFLLVIVLPAAFFMLATGMQKYQYARIVQDSRTDFSVRKPCVKHEDCKVCKSCNDGKPSNPPNEFCKCAQ